MDQEANNIGPDQNQARFSSPLHPVSAICLALLIVLAGVIIYGFAVIVTSMPDSGAGPGSGAEDPAVWPPPASGDGLLEDQPSSQPDSVEAPEEQGGTAGQALEEESQAQPSSPEENAEE